MKTIVLDDDPTGTQDASDVEVLLDWDSAAISAVLAEDDCVYLLTDSRSLSESAAIALAESIRRDGLEAGHRLGEQVRFVLRGDSTLRGHVFSETGVFMGPSAIMLFVPAYPAIGRTTRNGSHQVRIDGVDTPVEQTEYARDPVFPFRSGRLSDFVREKSTREPVPISLEVVRDADAWRCALASAPPGSVVVPDVVDTGDIQLIANAVKRAEDDGLAIVVRSSAALAACLAGVQSTEFLDGPIVPTGSRMLLVCGSHTAGATRQLERLEPRWGKPAVIATDLALVDSESAAKQATNEAEQALKRRGFAIIATERVRKPCNNTLEHGRKVMEALSTAVRSLIPHTDLVVSKGGITSTAVAHVGFGASKARVIGQILPGISVWRMQTYEGRTLPLVVVPGNVGGEDILEQTLEHSAGTGWEARLPRG